MRASKYECACAPVPCAVVSKLPGTNNTTLEDIQYVQYDQYDVQYNILYDTRDAFIFACAEFWVKWLKTGQKLTHCAIIFEYVNNEITLMLLIWKYI